eukprot:2993893-Pleurochrysis_carterae.AAC.7
MPRSLGPYIYARTVECAHLQCDTLGIGGSESRQDTVVKGTNGSIVYFKYTVYFQVESIVSVAGNTSIAFIRSGGVPLAQGDAIYLDAVDVSSIGGFPSSSFLGAHISSMG